MILKKIIYSLLENVTIYKEKENREIIKTIVKKTQKV